MFLDILNNIFTIFVIAGIVFIFFAIVKKITVKGDFATDIQERDAKLLGIVGVIFLAIGLIGIFSHNIRIEPLPTENVTIIPTPAIMSTSPISTPFVSTTTSILSITNVALEANGATALGGYEHLGPKRDTKRLIDGDTTNYNGDFGYASSDLNAPMTITLDKIYKINKINVLLWDRDDRYYQYKVEISINNLNWDTVIDKTSGQQKSWQNDTINPIDARYIRIIGTYNSDPISPKVFQVVELEAYTS